jgi:hypothetical protein
MQNITTHQTGGIIITIFISDNMIICILGSGHWRMFQDPTKIFSFLLNTYIAASEEHNYVIIELTFIHIPRKSL